MPLPRRMVQVAPKNDVVPSKVSTVFFAPRGRGEFGTVVFKGDVKLVLLDKALEGVVDKSILSFGGPTDIFDDV